MIKSISHYANVNKATMRYHSKLNRKNIWTVLNAGKEAGQPDLSYITGGNVKGNN